MLTVLGFPPPVVSGNELRGIYIYLSRNFGYGIVSPAGGKVQGGAKLNLSENFKILTNFL